MKTIKYLASFAVLIFGLSSLGIAQEGYFGQQASPPATAESQDVSPCLLAQLHGTGADTTVTQMPRCGLDAAKQKSVQTKTEKGKGIAASTTQEGDPAAPQNQVEYGGGGM